MVAEQAQQPPDRERVEESAIRISGSHCPYCKDVVRPDQDKVGCEPCMAWSHAECMAEHGRCAGCGAARPAPRPALDGGRPPVLHAPFEMGGPRVGFSRACARCSAGYQVRAADRFSAFCEPCASRQLRIGIMLVGLVVALWLFGPLVVSLVLGLLTGSF